MPLAAAIGWWVYFHRPVYEDWSAGFRGLLAGLRIALIAIVAILLLEPFFIFLQHEEEKPRLLVYDDMSQSVPTAQRNTLSALIRENEGNLSERYDVEYLQFGEEVQRAGDTALGLSYFTDFEQVVEATNDLFYNENIGAIVVASDGIQTRGTDPRYLDFHTNAPLMTYALGDSTVLPDLEVSEVLNNRLVFLGNDFQVKARIRARKFIGRQVRLSLKSGNTVVEERKIDIGSGDFAREVVFQTTAERTGMIRYTVELDVLDAEVNRQNNTAETFIEVLDNRTRVKILAKGPHPDVAAIKQAIEKSDQYEVEVSLIGEWNQRTDETDLFILHGLPADAQDQNKIKVIRDQEKPVLCILGSTVSMVHFSALDAGLKIEAPRARTDEAGGVQNTTFNLFNLPEAPALNRFPPLQVPFGEYTATGDHQVLLFQRIGSITTDKPLLLFASQQGWKRAVLAGEGWWRWRLIDLSMGNTWTDEVMLKTVQYLAIKQKRTRLNVNAPARIAEGREVTFEAEVYNESFEVINEPEVQLTLSDSTNRTMEYRFQNDGKGYALSIGTLPPGSYTWKAQVQHSGERFTQSGEFIVTRNRAEFVNLIADHNFLRVWAEKRGGQMFATGQEGALITSLLELETAKTVIHTSRQWKNIVAWKWVAFLLITLAALEWLLRKLNGYY